MEDAINSFSSSADCEAINFRWAPFHPAGIKVPPQQHLSAAVPPGHHLIEEDIPHDLDTMPNNSFYHDANESPTLSLRQLDPMLHTASDGRPPLPTSPNYDFTYNPAQVADTTEPLLLSQVLPVTPPRKRFLPWAQRPAQPPQSPFSEFDFPHQPHQPHDYVKVTEKRVVSEGVLADDRSNGIAREYFSDVAPQPAPDYGLEPASAAFAPAPGIFVSPLRNAPPSSQPSAGYAIGGDHELRAADTLV